MAIFEAKKEKNKDLLKLYRKLNYIMDFCATDQDLIYGSAVNILEPYDDMEAIKIINDQTDRSAFRHYVLSLEEDEDVSLFKEASIEVCELLSNFYGNYQVMMAVHINTDNLHTHYVANNIDYLTGERFDLNWKRLYELKCQISSILVHYNLSPILMRE
jgi:hypothetical protein